jgi:polyferredoxin
METSLLYAHPWLTRPPHRVKMMLVLSVAGVGVIALFTIGVWIWALTFHALGVFGDLELSLYFALVSYTTLGFGDVLLPQDWRLLAGMASANGLLSMGIYTAILIEVVRQVRILQAEALREQRHR